jgi:hypothetical protein
MREKKREKRKDRKQEKGREIRSAGEVLREKGTVTR